jgi:hypothetical protein
MDCIPLGGCSLRVAAAACLLALQGSHLADGEDFFKLLQGMLDSASPFLHSVSRLWFPGAQIYVCAEIACPSAIACKLIADEHQLQSQAIRGIGMVQ